MPLSPIHLSDYGLSVFPIPKNGGTTLWTWVYFIRTNGGRPSGNIYAETWLSDGPVQNEKLIIRRDPVERFISGYRNFRDKRGLRMRFDDFFQHFPRLYETNPVMHHHFKPQSQCYSNISLKDFAHVVDFEFFSEARFILERISCIKLPHIHLQRAEFSEFEVHEWQADLIERFYKCDYDSGFGVPDAWRKNLPTE